MTPEELRERTKLFAYAVVHFTRPLLRDPTIRDVTRQLLRCGTSTAANYRATQHARSRKEFVSRMALVLEESDESQFWLALIRDCELASGGELTRLVREAGELTAIFAASLRTAKARKRQ